MNQGFEIPSPTSYSWFFQDSKATKWTPEENKLFENALAFIEDETPDRWKKIAARIPGKSVGDVIKQYNDLVEDVIEIESGLIPIPSCYGREAFTLELVNNRGIDNLKKVYCVGGKRGTSTRHPEQERKKGVPWTEEEHRLFLMGLKKHGKGDWRNISRNFVTTRTPTQVASHAQKYFIRLAAGGKDKRRSSIHDITIINLQDTKPPSPKSKRPPSPDHSAMIMQPQQHPKMVAMDKQQYVWKSPYEPPAMVFNSAKNENMVMPPYCGISSYGPKLQEQNLLMGTVYGSQFGYYNPMYEMQHQ